MKLHGEWLSLLDISGPFLAEPILESHFPQGLDQLDPIKKKRIRQAYEEWRDAKDNDDPLMAELHKAWIDLVLKQGLELDEDDNEDVLKPASKVNEIKYEALEHGVVIRPTYAVVAGDDKPPSMLVEVLSPEIDLEAVNKQDGWSASSAERMLQLCRANKVRLGLLTNGEQWMLIDAPEGGVTTYASWYARIWSQEPITLQAFVTLLSIRRFFLDESQQLPALIDESLKHQDEVTDALGDQVRRAVEVLVQALDKADQDRDRELLKDVEPFELYEAGLTVMMRLVFLLSAEERALLPVDSLTYESYYAVSTLRMQLRDQAGIHSEEILSHRRDAWSRLLAIFRAVYGGVDHETLSMPALGGSLFDPDRFPFLEGREKGSNWRCDPARPLPIDNRTVLLLLDAIQLFQGRTLSYRALDIEQIGYVYEGLLERTVVRAKDITLELDATKKSKQPWVTWGELEDTRLNGDKAVEELLVERTGSSASRIKNDLKKPVTDAQKERLLTVCQGDQTLRDRLAPYHHLLRIDPWEYPLIYPKGAFMVATGTERRETGTHYTPKSLTESIVETILEPVAYVGPAEGKPRNEWQLKSSAELLELKICDPAMGSGAFLVQVCRWLSERLVEAWGSETGHGKFITVDGEALDSAGGSEPMSSSLDERLLIARRLVAEKCLYGVDLNPLAVELAKLSIWLITLAKGRPFGFLDHNLRSGDSLLGLHKLEQLTRFSLHPEEKHTASIFASNIESAVNDTLLLRKQLREIPIRDIRDVEHMAQLDQQARQKIEQMEHIADAMIGEALAAGGNQRTMDASMDNLSSWAAAYIEGDNETGWKIITEARKSLSRDLPAGKSPRKPFHWVLEFPEVFERGGFDGIVGNPPFLGGKRIGTVLGESYQFGIKSLFDNTKGAADLSAFFFRKACLLSGSESCFCFISTNTIAQGDTRKVGLEYMIKNENCTVFNAKNSTPWPGKAGVHISVVALKKGRWDGEIYLDGNTVANISSSLEEETDFNVFTLAENKGGIAEGIKIHGNGFLVDESEYNNLVKINPNNSSILQLYLGGEDITDNPSQRTVRYAINFGNFDKEQAEGFPELFDIVTNRVKPYRDGLKGQIHEKRYWIFWDRREAFFDQLDKSKRILVCSGIAKYLALEFVQSDAVLSQRLKVFKFQDYTHFSVLQSNLHESWIRRNSSTLETRLSYSNRDAFATFPFCSYSTLLEEVGRSYYECRREMMLKYNEGLTSTYNRFHNYEDSSANVDKFRDLHVQMDTSVAAAYGWDDLDLGHRFHETKQGIRFTISEEARREVLRRLLKLNNERYDEEVAQGLHHKKKKSTTRKTKTCSAKDDRSLNLFGD
ncbi:Eco57I restriction-modification methylase domain-containing protein [Halioxenophilus sp. WMMB6]|uniref:Eco57I restriction-modification methylase domain-containing protein n=1 Tax=Halioxenophilus sp. WMMB6 TaxID=3073815 RepID=UPI00295E30E7|nr:type IIL restriction-modification enzyme MmeI [Halioxenophilus sp. WMMB6]